MTTDGTPRWMYRFRNYMRAFALLRDAVETMEQRELSRLEKEGVIQRFGYTIELAWNVMRDYLESENVVFEQITPRSVIRRTFEANLVEDGQTWMDALDMRNRMSRTYDLATFERVIEAIRRRYLGVFGELHAKLLERSAEWQEPRALGTPTPDDRANTVAVRRRYNPGRPVWLARHGQLSRQLGHRLGSARRNRAGECRSAVDAISGEQPAGLR